MGEPRMTMKSSTVQDFHLELLEAGLEGTDAVWCLFDQAMEKWKDEPEKLAELAVEMLHCAVVIADNPQGESVPYGLLFAEANRYANRHYSPLLMNRYHNRLLEYYWSVVEKLKDTK